MNDYDSNKKPSAAKVIMSVILAIAVCFVSFGAGYLTRSCSSGDYTELEWALDVIKANYYDLDEDGNLKDFTVDDYLSLISSELLDPYSGYMNEEQYKDFVSSGEGNAYGIGVRISSVEADMLKIVSVSGNSPMEKACFTLGIDPVGKKIIAVSDADGSNYKAASDYETFSKNLTGYEAHTEFKIYLEGVGQGITVSREAYIESYVSYYDSEKTYLFRSEDYSGVPEGKEFDGGMSGIPADTAYIKFDEFNGDATSQMAGALKYMQRRGKTKLILDMRNNGGGYLNILCDVASYFINNDGKKESLVATAKYKNGKVEEYKTSANRYVPLEKLTVMANEGSASATECLIGALITYGELSYDNFIVTSDGTPDTVNGNRTYGKGIMQKTFLSNHGSAIKLTSAYIYWPDKTTNIHKKGIFAPAENSVTFADGLEKALEVSAR